MRLRETPGTVPSVYGNFRNRNSAVCHSNSVRADEAEAFVFGKLAELVRRPRLLKQVVAKTNSRFQASSGPLQQEMVAAQSLLDENKAKQARYFKLYESDGISADALVERLGELKGEAINLTRRIDDLSRELAASTSTSVDYAQVRYLLSNLQRFLTKADRHRPRRCCSC